MKIKSKDIAEALNLSTATVSLALNNKKGVNEETRRRVLELLKHKQKEEYEKTLLEQEYRKGMIVMLNYFKHGIIMNRRKGNDAFSLLNEMELQACKYGYEFVYEDYYEKTSNLDQKMNQWKEKNMRGLYIMGVEMTHSDIYKFSQYGVPIVVGDNNFFNEGIDSFLIDNKEGICRGVDYLVDKGHSRIVYLAENIHIFNFAERREAFLYEMQKRECGDANQHILNLGSNEEEVYKNMVEYLKSGRCKATAFVLESSVVSIGAIKALLELSVRIPKDISLIGFDAIPPDSLLAFQLTLIKGTHTRRHLAAIKHLIRRIEDSETEIVRTYYKTRLLEGDSVFDKTRFIYHPHII